MAPLEEQNNEEFSVYNLSYNKCTRIAQYNPDIANTLSIQEYRFLIDTCLEDRRIYCLVRFNGVRPITREDLASDYRRVIVKEYVRNSNTDILDVLDGILSLTKDDFPNNIEEIWREIRRDHSLRRTSIRLRQILNR